MQWMEIGGEGVLLAVVEREDERPTLIGCMKRKGWKVNDEQPLMRSAPDQVRPARQEEE